MIAEGLGTFGLAKYVTCTHTTSDLILKKHDIHTNVKTAGKLMNYVNYEKKVVEFYGVELRGWPCPVFKNPGNLRRDEVSLLLVELGSGGCRWHKLSEEELLQRILSNTARHLAGEVIYKPRKTAKGGTAAD